MFYVSPFVNSNTHVLNVPLEMIFTRSEEVLGDFTELKTNFRHRKTSNLFWIIYISKKDNSDTVGTRCGHNADIMRTQWGQNRVTMLYFGHF